MGDCNGLTVVGRVLASGDIYWYDGYQALLRLIAAGLVETISPGGWGLLAAFIVADDAELLVLLALLDIVAACCCRNSDPIILILTGYQIIGRHRKNYHVVPLP